MYIHLMNYILDIQGFQTQRLGHEIVWNRTANLTGGEGHNLPLDLVNEFLNRDFKGLYHYIIEQSKVT